RHWEPALCWFPEKLLTAYRAMHTVVEPEVVVSSPPASIVAAEPWGRSANRTYGIRVTRPLPPTNSVVLRFGAIFRVPDSPHAIPLLLLSSAIRSLSFSLLLTIAPDMLFHHWHSAMPPPQKPVGKGYPTLRTPD